MNPNFRPKMALDYTIEDLDGGALLYRSGAEGVVSLNETAALILKICDGSRSIGDIVDLLSTHYPETSADLGREIRETIEQLAKERVLVDAAESASP